jgi:hypothetical protein
LAQKRKILTVTANGALIQINRAVRGAEFHGVIMALLGHLADKGQADDDRPEDRPNHIGDGIGHGHAQDRV